VGDFQAANEDVGQLPRLRTNNRDSEVLDNDLGLVALLVSDGHLLHVLFLEIVASRVVVVADANDLHRLLVQNLEQELSAVLLVFLIFKDDALAFANLVNTETAQFKVLAALACQDDQKLLIERVAPRVGDD